MSYVDEFGNWKLEECGRNNLDLDLTSQESIV